MPPENFALVTAHGISLHRHWQPRRGTVLLRSADEYVEAMRHHLDEAVRCRLRGTDDVGATLSAGLDSSAVATTAARLLQPSGRKVIAFTAVPREGYDGPTPERRIGDEGPLAAMTAAMHPNIEHMLVRSDRHTPFDDLDRSFFFADQPSSLLMSWGLPDARADCVQAEIETLVGVEHDDFVIDLSRRQAGFSHDQGCGRQRVHGCLQRCVQ